MMTHSKDKDPAADASPAEQAAYWFVRRDGRDLTADEAAEFAGWLEASSANRAAFGRMASTWSLLDGAADSDELRPVRARVRAIAGPQRRRRVVAGGLLAAALAIGVAFGTPFLRSPGSEERHAPSAVAVTSVRYTTDKGELKVVTLADGSRVTLNTGSEIIADIGPARRSIRLVTGQALFEVAHDARRPFVVSAADREVTALGTVFEVRVDPGRMEVVLVTGKVAVDGNSPAKQPRAILRPGEALVVAAGAAAPLARVDVNAKLRWREGFVEFADEPLGRAIEEINRYSDRVLVLEDEGLATERVSGVFRTGDPDRFIAIVGELLPVEAHAVNGRILISRRGN